MRWMAPVVLVVATLLELFSSYATARNGQYLFREAARTSYGGATSPYQTDPYASSLVARWDFDEAAWTNDSTTNGFNLVIDGTGSMVSNVVVGTNIYGREEKAAYFSSGRRLRRIIQQSECLAWSNSSMVVSYWVYRARTNVAEYVYGFGGTNAFNDGVMHNWAINSYVGNILVRSNGTTLTADGYGLGSYTNGIWYHLVEYRSSKTTGNKVWVNGVMRAGDFNSAFRTYTFDQILARLLSAGQNAAISFGDRSGSQSPFAGFIDNARVYNTVAATNNIPWLFQNTHPTNCLEAR